MRPVDATIRELIEGAYDLTEWHKPDGIVKPPDVEGRFMLLDGALSTIMCDRAGDDVHTTLALYGRYTLSDVEFAYRYDAPLRITERGSAVKVWREPLWNGMRVFAIEKSAATVRLSSISGHEFLFNASGLKYSEAGATLRVWRRISSR